MVIVVSRGKVRVNRVSCLVVAVAKVALIVPTVVFALVVVVVAVALQ